MMPNIDIHLNIVPLTAAAAFIFGRAILAACHN